MFPYRCITCCCFLLVRQFYKDAFTIFNSAQAIHQVHVAPLMSGNLPQTDGSSSLPTYEQELEVKRAGYMRELAENYMEAVEEVVRDTQLDVSYALLNILLSPPCPMA